MENKSGWFELIDEWETSQLSQPEFCQSKNISLSSFTTWRSRGIKEGRFSKCPGRNSKNSQSDKAIHALGFSEMNVTSDTSDHCAIKPSQIIEVQLPHGIVLRIPAHVHCQ